MPVISRFFGILIRIYFADHQPPHLHAAYGEFEAMLAIDDFQILRGALPGRAHALVVEWMTLRQAELREDWKLAQQGLPLRDIAPLG